MGEDPDNSDPETDVEQSLDSDHEEWEPITNTSKLQMFDFAVATVGINEELHERYFDKSPYDFFRLFLTDEILRHIVNETNRYAAQEKAKITKPKSRVHKWTDTNENEIELFLPFYCGWACVGFHQWRTIGPRSKYMKVEFPAT